MSKELQSIKFPGLDEIYTVPSKSKDIDPLVQEVTTLKDTIGNLTNVMNFIGTSITDPAVSGATVAGHTLWEKGDVVLYGGKEFVLTNYVNSADNWHELGNEGSHALKSVTITGGDGLTGGGSLANDQVIKHAVPTGASAGSTASNTQTPSHGGSFNIPVVTTDKFGHVTGRSTATVTLPNIPVESVNGKTGSVVLTASDVGADTSGSANTALASAKSYTDAEVGKTKNEIQSATSELNANKADVIQTRYGSFITIDNSAHTPIKGLNIYGKTTQNGTPAPTDSLDDSYIPLINAGKNGNVGVSIYGKNLFNNDISLVGGMSVTKEDGGVRNHWGRAISLPAGTYTISARTASTDVIYLYGCTNKKDGTFGQQCSLWQNQTYKGPHTITVENGDTLYFYEGIGYTGEAVRNIFAVFDIQIEVGTSATAFEPYKAPQTMTINTPDGLCGKPVDNGGNYTDENGQQWVCDELDLARGVYIKRIHTVDFSKGEWVEEFSDSLGEDGDFWGSIFRLSDNAQMVAAKEGMPVLCSHINWASGLSESAYTSDGINVHADYMIISLGDFPQEILEELAENSVKVQYVMATPETIPLSAEELEAYAALHTNKPNTTIVNNGGAGMTVKYYTPSTAVQMVHTPEDEGKVLTVDEHGCVILGELPDTTTVGVTQTLTSGTEIGAITVNGETTKLYAPASAQGGEDNQNAFSNIKVGSTTIQADSTTDTFELVGSNITLTPDATNDKITIGLPVAGATLGGVKSGGDITVASDGTVSVNDYSHNHTIANVDGLQSALDNKLDKTGGTITGNLSVDGYTKTGNCYNLPPVYRHNTGVLINLGSIQSETMITLNITGNAYTGGRNINSVIQFYHFQTSEGFYGYGGTHYGANFGNVTVYKYDGKMYAWFTGTALSDYCTFNVQVISNKNLGDINISDSAPHTADEGATYITDIVPVVAQLTDTTYTLGSFGITASADELNYIDGVTSNIQTQLNSKASTAVATVVSNGLMSADDKTRLICHTHTRFGGYDSGGYLKIKINAGYNWMLSFILRVYSSYRATDIQISGYSYGSNHWYSQRAITIADSHPDSNVEVNFGYDDDGLLWIATPAGDYSAAGIFNVVNGFDQIPADQWENLFTITREETLSGTVQSTSNSTMLASSSSAGLMSIADKTKLDNFANSRIITIAEGRYNEDDDVDEFTNIPFSTIKTALEAGELIVIYTSENGSAYDNSYYYEGFNEYYYPIFVSSTVIKFQTLPRGSYGGYYTLTIDTNGIAPIKYSNIDRNTTYTLSKSGTDIVLTGSDGSMSSVTDATGSGSGSSGTNRTNSGALSVSSYPLPDARFYLVTVHLDNGSGLSTLNETFALDWYGLYDAWQNKGSATFATAGRIYMNHTNTSNITTTEGYLVLKITAYNPSAQSFTIAVNMDSKLDDSYTPTIVRVCSYS